MLRPSFTFCLIFRIKTHRFQILQRLNTGVNNLHQLANLRPIGKISGEKFWIGANLLRPFNDRRGFGKGEDRFSGIIQNFQDGHGPHRVSLEIILSGLFSLQQIHVNKLTGNFFQRKGPANAPAARRTPVVIKFILHLTPHNIWPRFCNS